MAKKIEANEMANEITKWLTEYSEEVTDVAKGVVDEVAEGCFNEVKNHVTWKDKKYSNSFALNTSFENKRNKRRTWYVKSPHYRLTHLLEFGHVTRNGTSRAKAYPHVKYGDEFVKNNFEREMKEAIEKCRI
jgi:hypothetical protein